MADRPKFWARYGVLLAAWVWMVFRPGPLRENPVWFSCIVCLFVVFLAYFLRRLMVPLLILGDDEVRWQDAQSRLRQLPRSAVAVEASERGGEEVVIARTPWGDRFVLPIGELSASDQEEVLSEFRDLGPFEGFADDVAKRARAQVSAYPSYLNLAVWGALVPPFAFLACARSVRAMRRKRALGIEPSTEDYYGKGAAIGISTFWVAGVVGLILLGLWLHPKTP